MYYRFNSGPWVEADTFEEAQRKAIEDINNEEEKQDNWTKCRCTGFQHHHACPEWAMCY